MPKLPIKAGCCSSLVRGAIAVNASTSGAVQTQIELHLVPPAAASLSHVLNVVQHVILKLKYVLMATRKKYIFKFSRMNQMD